MSLHGLLWLSRRQNFCIAECNRRRCLTRPEQPGRASKSVLQVTGVTVRCRSGQHEPLCTPSCPPSQRGFPSTAPLLPGTTTGGTVSVPNTDETLATALVSVEDKVYRLDQYSFSAVLLLLPFDGETTHVRLAPEMMPLTGSGILLARRGLHFDPVVYQSIRSSRPLLRCSCQDHMF